jgi:hypothetical protein
MENRIACPNCAEPISNKAIMCRFCQRGLSSQHFKKCRFCAEMVRRSAHKCRFCMANLSDTPPGSTGPPRRPPQGAPVPRVPLKPVKATETTLPLPEPEKEVETIQPKVIKGPD